MRLAIAALFGTLLCAQTTINIGGTNYTVKSDPIVWLDGAGGALTTATQNSGVNGRANPANLPYSVMKTNCDNFIAAGYTDPFADGGNSAYGRFNSCAMVWWAQGANVADPNGYATAARYGLLHLENFVSGTFGCDTSVAYCNGRTNDVDYSRLYTPTIAQAYSVLSAGGFLSAGDKTTILAKLLNDNTTAHNGVDSVACANPGTPNGTGTLTASGTAVTIAGGDTSQLAVGGVILSTSNGALAFVTSITDSTHFVVDKSVSWTGISWHYGRPWQAGDCGLIWLQKHHNAAPPITIGEEATYNADYFNGNTFVLPNGNLTFTALTSYVSVGLATAKDDSRGALLAQQSINYYLLHQYAYTLSSYVGFTSAGAAYTNDRTGWMIQMIAAMVKNSLVSGPDLATGKQYSQLLLPYAYYTALPDNPVDMLTFQDVYAPKPNARPLWLGLYLQSSQPEAGYGNYYLRSMRTDWTAAGLGQSTSCTAGLCNYTPWAFVFTDPAQSQCNFSGAPTLYLFGDTDYAACQSAGYTCYANAAVSHSISKSGWTSTDSAVLSQFAYIYSNPDHSGFGDWGAVHIYRQGYLLAGDAQYGNSNLQMDDLISIGSDSNWAAVGSNTTAYRWAGAHPTGDSQSRYTYSLMDVAGDYKGLAGVVRAQRQQAHFKKAGSQDYVIWYDDIATSAGETIKAYLHFYHASCYTLSSCSAGAAGITWGGGNNGGTVINAAASSLLSTAVLPTAGSNTALLTYDNANGTYTGGNGYTFRATICAENSGAPGSCNASATAAEWIVVHMPANGTSAVMPALTQPAATNFRVVQVADASSPKVVAFAMGGNTYTSASFTTTHSGTAQYLITGLAAGTYSAVVNGSTVAAGITVSAADNTLYFESTAGAVLVSQGAAGCSITNGSLAGGVVNVAYNETLTSAGCTAPLTWSISVGSLPLGLSLSPSTGAITGTPSAAGTSNFTVKVVDNVANTATLPLSITISTAITVTPGSISNGVVGAVYPTQTFSASGGTAPYSWNWSAITALPPGLSLNASTGAISGTPAQAGTYLFSVKATDANSVQGSVPITISISLLGISTGGGIVVQ